MAAVNQQRAGILIAACGNTMAGDDAFGPCVAEELGRRPLPGVEVLDLGMNPGRLIDHLGGRRALAIVDAAIAGDQAVGSIAEYDWDDPRRPALASARNLSSHGLSMADQLELARRLKILPPVVRAVLLLCAGGSVGDAAGRQLSDRVQQAADRLQSWAAAIVAPANV